MGSLLYGWSLTTPPSASCAAANRPIRSRGLFCRFSTTACAGNKAQAHFRFMLGVDEQSPDAGRSRLHVKLGATGGHVIVCGLSNLGLRIAEQLHEAAVPC